jgi:hypothetical protein
LDTLVNTRFCKGRSQCPLAKSTCESAADQVQHRLQTARRLAPKFGKGVYRFQLPFT